MAQTNVSPLRPYLQADPGDAATDTLNPIDRILDAVRNHLGMEIAFASRIADGKREFTHLRADCPVPVSVGDAEPLEQTLCQLVLDGVLPALMHDASQHEAALPMPITLGLPVGSHLNVPLRLSDGSIYGTFCCVSRQPDWSLTERDMGTLRAFAELASHLIESDLCESRQRAVVCGRIGEVLSGEGITILHQPIHDLLSGTPIGVECLARFSDCSERGPDCWFAEAGEVGLAIELELMAVRSALQTLRHVPAPCYVAINVSPATVISGALEGLIKDVPAGRLVIEVTEHDQVSDYALLRAALQPLRRHARIAIDDVGAGYAGLRHLVDLQPDILKLDMSLTRDIGSDPARKALAHALVHFAQAIGCSLVAEGVETEAERRTLAELRVQFAQGYLFSHPMPVIAAQQLLLGRTEPDPVTCLDLPKAAISRRA